MTTLNARNAIRILAAIAIASAVAGLVMATTVITEPGDLDVVGHGPEPDALMNHYALENSVSFQVGFRRGVCSSSNVCIGGGDDGAACNTSLDCSSGPLNFISGETEIFDENGTSIDVMQITDVEFQDGTGLQNIGLCKVDATIACRGPGKDDETRCGTTDPTCEARPSVGYVPDHANYRLRNPQELIKHNLVPAEAEIRICFDEFNSGPACDELVMRQSLVEYRTAPGPTYIYPMGPPDTPGERLRNSEAHEYFSHHRGVNNQRHAYDVLSKINNQFRVPSACVNGVCAGGVRDADPCSADIDCSANENVFVYAEPVLAMADGEVVALTQNYPENPNPPDKLPNIGAGDCRVVKCGDVSKCDGSEIPIVGNSVFIKHDNGEVSMVAHLIPGSNNHLSCGDPVLQGDQIGLVGNSGNSTDPHLHYSTDVKNGFWDAGNYSWPSYVTNVAFASGSDPAIRRQLDVSLHSFFFFDIWPPVTPSAQNPALGSGAVNEMEPNDTLDEHNALTLPTVVTAVVEDQDVGDLAVRGDSIEDVFRFDLQATDEIRIELNGADANENLDVYALSEDLRVLNETGQGTSTGSYEEVCVALEPGAYYLMVSNVDATQEKNEDYTLAVASDLQTISAAITNAQQPIEVDGSCEATIEFQIDIHDNCCLDPDDLALNVSASNPTTNATLGTVMIDVVNPTSPRDIEVTGHVDVSALTSCPASVVIEASAQDCSGNVVDTGSQGTSASVLVLDTIPPYVDQGDDDLYCLWPPNHKYVCFDAGQFMPVIKDNCEASPRWEFDACDSDQPDNGKGDGNTIDDCVLDGDAQGFCARAERQGMVAAGRHYDLDIEATDACGNVSSATEIGNIYVPHDQSPQLACIAAPVTLSAGDVDLISEMKAGTFTDGITSIGERKELRRSTRLKKD